MMVTTYNEEVYGVLDKYRIEYTERGVQDNLDTWAENKEELLNLLRKHPNWNEEAMAVIFKVTENREINRYVVQDYKRDILHLGQLLKIPKKDYSNFYYAIDVATNSYTKIITDNYDIEKIKQYSDVSCVVGQKTSRIINKICRKFGIDKHPEFNAQFAKLADSLNPLQVKRTALLSVHPCDYLEMSNRDNSWNSCHTLDSGGYMAGTLSYMNDKVSMIFYTVNDDVTCEYYKAPKRTREVFCYRDGILLQSRLYPRTNDEDTKEVYRNIVQKIIANCLNTPNLWILDREQYAVNTYCKTHSDSLHYEDYTYPEYKANVSLLKDVHNKNNKIYIGYAAYCVDCSNELTSEDNINCCNNNRVTCADCGETICEDNICIVNDVAYCLNCVSWCSFCNNYFCGDIYTAYNRNGHMIYICEDCRGDEFEYCDRCNQYYHYEYGNYVNNSFYCDNCLNDNFCICHICHNCREYIQNTDAVEINNHYYCEDCAKNIKDENKNENERECA